MLLEVGLTTNSFLINNNKLNAIKKTANTISKTLLSKNWVNIPPIITKTTEGIPMDNNSFLSNPFLKSVILLMLLNT